MMIAARQLVEDFLSTIIFLLAVAAAKSIPVAVTIAIAVALTQLVVLKWRGRSLDAMQWLSLGLVIALGAITLVADDPRFILLKPGLIHFAVAGAMLRRGWLGRYLPPIARARLSEREIVVAGYLWAALMAAIGAAIILVAVTCSFEVWAWFVSAGVMALQIGAFLLQYLAFRILIARRRRLAGP